MRSASIKIRVTQHRKATNVLSIKNITVNKVIATGAAYSAISVYSPSIRHGNLLFVLGQLGLKSCEMVSQNAVDQASQALAKFVSIATSAIIEIEDIQNNDIDHRTLGLRQDKKGYGAIFVERYHARWTIEISTLPKDGNVEVEAIITRK